MRFSKLVVILSFVFPLRAQSFFVSEIFINKTNKEEYQWLEIKNLRNNKINIAHISITISSSKNNIQAINKKITIPIAFTDYLILASRPDIIYPLCAVEKIPIIYIDNLKLKKSGPYEICVEINKEKSCVQLLSQQKFINGVSYGFKKDSFIMQYEPCHLGKRLFATPGGPFMACKNNKGFHKEIIRNCNREVRDIKTITLTAQLSKDSVVNFKEDLSQKKISNIDIKLANHHNGNKYFLMKNISSPINYFIYSPTQYLIDSGVIFNKNLSNINVGRYNNVRLIDAYFIGKSVNKKEKYLIHE